MALVVLGFQRASIWGWIENKDSPITPFGLALTPFVLLGGAVCLGVFSVTQQRRSRRGLPVLIDPIMFGRRYLRSETQELAALHIERNLPFVAQSGAEAAVSKLEIPKVEATEIVALYERAQLLALENGALLAGIIALAGAITVLGLPKRLPEL